MLTEERRLIIKGWKGSPDQTFVSYNINTTDAWVEHERARIGEELPDWQPHITEVILEHREVTEWRPVPSPSQS